MIDLTIFNEDADIELEGDLLLEEGGEAEKQVANFKKADDVEEECDEDDEDAVYFDETVDDVGDIVNEEFNYFKPMDPIDGIILTEEEISSVEIDLTGYEKEYTESDIHDMSAEEIATLAENELAAADDDGLFNFDDEEDLD